MKAETTTFARGVESTVSDTEEPAEIPTPLQRLSLKLAHNGHGLAESDPAYFDAGKPHRHRALYIRNTDPALVAAMAKYLVTRSRL